MSKSAAVLNLAVGQELQEILLTDQHLDVYLFYPIEYNFLYLQKLWLTFHVIGYKVPEY